ncbi:type II toxin-antitoxin system MqsA family antitoxin [Methylobacillus gramineus]|nr:type II toxin-antitoxin system MqsA family antitoxin [Methylobacillus gramineus]
MKCPECGGANLMHDVRDTAYTYKDKTTQSRHLLD